MRGIGIHSGRPITMIDHLVPLCHLLEIPYLCTDPWVQTTIELFYPPLNVQIAQPEDHSLQKELEPYDYFLYQYLYRLPHGAFLFADNYFFRGDRRSICCLHGNSDKKRTLYWIERYADEDIVLFYGQYFLDYAAEKNVTLKHPILTGNYRRAYAKQHAVHFQKKIAPFLFQRTDRKTVLYAPTWTYPSMRSDWRIDYSSFFEVHQAVLDTIPDDYQVLVKLHPYLVYLYPDEVAQVKEQYSESEQILFIDEVPLIYPLLQHVDIYLGDYSSVGYDFLAFDRPLFFMNMEGRSDPGVSLFQCGQTLGLEDLPQLYKIMDKTDPKKHRQARQQAYEYAFGAPKPLAHLKEEILEALQ